MTQVTIPYQFQNQTTADANQVDQNFNALANTINGGLDDSNMKAGGLTSLSINTSSLGVPLSQDIFTTSFVLSGLSVTKDGTNLNQVDLSAGTAYLKQVDGSFKRLNIIATNFRIVSISATYYIDLNHDGSISWGTSHSTDAVGYITLASVISDASGNVATVTPNNNSYLVSLFGTSPVNIPGLAANPLLWFIR